MFQAIEKYTRTPIAHSAILDVTAGAGDNGGGGVVYADSMESFWLAETLKYFYLVFAGEGEVDLDEWVLNTEAHPLRRPERNQMGRVKQ